MIIEGESLANGRPISNEFKVRMYKGKQYSPWHLVPPPPILSTSLVPRYFPHHLDSPKLPMSTPYSSRYLDSHSPYPAHNQDPPYSQCHLEAPIFPLLPCCPIFRMLHGPLLTLHVTWRPPCFPCHQVAPCCLEPPLPTSHLEAPVILLSPGCSIFPTLPGGPYISLFTWLPHTPHYLDHTHITFRAPIFFLCHEVAPYYLESSFPRH